MTSSTRYVLVTPAKNEESFIGTTIDSVIRQTVRPIEWIIVSDGSTDRTDQIVQEAGALHSWIRLLALPPRAERSFSAVVRATDAGVRALSTQNYEYVGLLDSDVRFQPDYFERLLGVFTASPRLGLAGGMVIDEGEPKDRVPLNQEDIPGAAQFFRRRCFEELGGLLAIPEGGWDALTCARARMLGYETRLVTQLVMDHLKPRNISEGGIIRRKWQMGVRDYALGYHPLFEAIKCLSRLRESPVVAGGIAWWIGYCWASAQRRQRLLSRDLLRFVRAEQMARLRRMLGLGGAERREEMSKAE